MGCDIHMQVEVRRDGKWERVKKLPGRVCVGCQGNGKFQDNARCYWCLEEDTPGISCSPYDIRNYTVFSVLAGVRNYNDLIPISEPRGLPEDVDRLSDRYDDIYGDHSFTWLTLDEVLAYSWDKEMPIDSRGERETIKDCCKSFLTFVDSLLGLGSPQDIRLVFGFDS